MLTITLLGTAATMPLPERALTAAVAECGGHSLLLDCGEGTQTAARRAGVNLMRADAICLTHYHGDHIFGLPGLLQTLGAQGRTRPLTLLGPEGLLEVWRAVYALTGPLPYAVKPLVCRAGQPVALDALSDGWPAGATLLPVATKHRVRSLGYRLELPRAGRFDPEKARALGVPVTQWRLLQRGQAVPLAERMVQPAEVLGAPRKGLRRQCALPGAGTGGAGGRPAALRCHLCPAGAAGAGRAVGAQHLWPKRSAGGKSRGKAAVAGALFPHGHRPGGASCTGAKHLPGGRMRL